VRNEVIEQIKKVERKFVQPSELIEFLDFIDFTVSLPPFREHRERVESFVQLIKLEAASEHPSISLLTSAHEYIAPFAYALGAHGEILDQLSGDPLSNLIAELRDHYNTNPSIGTATYENRFVAFVDILGFSNEILDDNNKSQPPRKLSNFLDFTLINSGAGTSHENLQGNAVARGLNAALNFSGFDADIHQHFGLPNSERVRSTHFSDSIILSSPQHNPDLLIYSLDEIWRTALREKVLIRGGVVFGPIIHKSSTLVGPALIEAYQLENRTKHPRIAFHDFALARMSDELKAKYIERDVADGTNFLSNILGQLLPQIPVSPDILAATMEAKFSDISDYVDAQIGLFAEDDGVRKKYEWFKSRITMARERYDKQFAR
tara:strand:+ start:442 stop:1572 length:1131 start_codon:yes stop_codon:yes gene_type:complete